jgi:peptidoglycan/LPS O-acetylase OafA/YrhL
VADKVRRQLWKSGCMHRPARRRKALLLALAAAASSAASAINGWTNPPTTWQMTAAACGFVLTACLCLASQHAVLQKKVSHFDVRLTDRKQMAVGTIAVRQLD